MEVEIVKFLSQKIQKVFPEDYSVWSPIADLRIGQTISKRQLRKLPELKFNNSTSNISENLYSCRYSFENEDIRNHGLYLLKNIELSVWPENFSLQKSWQNWDHIKKTLDGLE